MTAKPFHLAWFTPFHLPNWQGSWPSVDAKTWTNADFFVEFAKALERACFDFLMMEDASAVPDEFGDQPLVSAVKYGGVRLDPVLLSAALTRETSKIGLITTMSTTFYPPYLLARSVSTMDHMSGGRAGWNIVTSSGDNAAQNFGLPELPEHDSRYARADEYVRLVKALWNTWDADAVVADSEAGVYADGTKVHYANFEGEYFASRGPLNVPRSPQGDPIVCQAGSSPAGRAFGAKYADVILGVPTTPERMKEYVDDIRARMVQNGRDPQSCKILFIMEPVLGATDEEAAAEWERLYEPTDATLEAGLIAMSEIVHIDFSKFSLDAPLADGLTTNGHQSSMANMYTYGETLREVAVRWLRHFTNHEIVGSPDTVARKMGEMMEFVGGDGFLITGPLSRKYVTQVTDGLVPALQKRGLMRTRYDGPLLRDNLLAF